MHFGMTPADTVFAFTVGEHPVQEPVAMPLDSTADPRYLNYIYARTNDHRFASTRISGPLQGRRATLF